MAQDTHLLTAFFGLCWAFNAASLQSMVQGGPGFSATDPTLGSSVLVDLLLIKRGERCDVVFLLSCELHTVFINTLQVR